MIFKNVLITAIILSVSSIAWSDRQEGWVYKKTADGKTVKVPKRQYFEFDGANIKGNANLPGQGVLNKRPLRDRRSLIPIRQSFRKDALENSGYTGK